MFGKFVGKILAAPFRIASLPIKLMDAAMGEKVRDNVFDDLADTTEEQIKKIIEDSK